MVAAPPPATALPEVAERLFTLPKVVALPPTVAPPAPKGPIAKPPPAALALEVAPEVALFELSAAPLPELAAPDTVPEDALDVVFVAAMLELLTAAEATPVNAITAMAIRDFFMIIPLNSEFSDK